MEGWECNWYEGPMVGLETGAPTTPFYLPTHPPERNAVPLPSSSVRRWPRKRGCSSPCSDCCCWRKHRRFSEMMNVCSLRT